MPDQEPYLPGIDDPGPARYDPLRPVRYRVEMLVKGSWVKLATIRGLDAAIAVCRAWSSRGKPLRVIDYRGQPIEVELLKLKVTYRSHSQQEQAFHD